MSEIDARKDKSGCRIQLQFFLRSDFCLHKLRPCALREQSGYTLPPEERMGVTRTRNGAVGLLVLITLALTPLAAEAQISIVGAQPDTVANILTITGSPFEPGIRAFLFVNGVTELPVVSQTVTNLRLTLPNGVPTGSFVLFLFQPSTGQFGSFNVAVSSPAARVIDANGGS
jgi:hypothetical protein